MNSLHHEVFPNQIDLGNFIPLMSNNPVLRSQTCIKHKSSSTNIHKIFNEMEYPRLFS